MEKKKKDPPEYNCSKHGYIADLVVTYEGRAKEAYCPLCFADWLDSFKNITKVAT